MSSVGQTLRDSDTHRGVLPRSVCALRSPSVAEEAPPVRRRRSSGGVRVIRMPQPLNLLSASKLRISFSAYEHAGFQDCNAVSVMKVHSRPTPYGVVGDKNKTVLMSLRPAHTFEAMPFK